MWIRFNVQIECYFLFILLNPPLLRPHVSLLYQLGLTDNDNCGAIDGMNDLHGKPKYLEKTYPSAALFATNSTWNGPGSNLVHRSGKQGSNRLSYSTAWRYSKT
jgi:hypothetical protein